MTDQVNTPPGGGTGGAPPQDGGQQQQAAQRPAWVPEQFFDPDKGAIKDEFGAHYSEVATFHKTETERQAALKARKAEDIKIELKLPDTVKVPEGFDLKIDEKDPRIPVIREMALKRGWDQDTVNELVAFDAQQKLEAHTAEMARVQAEDQKLGDNGKVRKEAVANWAKALKDKNELSADEYEEIRMTATTAAGVSLLEKLIAKSNGSVPGAGGSEPPKTPEPQTLEQKWFGTPPANRKAS